MNNDIGATGVTNDFKAADLANSFETVVATNNLRTTELTIASGAKFGAIHFSTVEVTDNICVLGVAHTGHSIGAPDVTNNVDLNSNIHAAEGSPPLELLCDMC